MKQILLNLETGKTVLMNCPAPNCSKGILQINTTITLVSSGTERMLVDFSRASYIGKAKQQPEKIRMVLDKLKTDGIVNTFDSINSKLKQPIALGYCNVGVISELGSGTGGFNVGDRVVSNGSHAEIVNVPINLCAKIPENVSDESAVFTVLASIGLQGIRLVNPSIGELVVVIGAGLIGLLTIQILRANGCSVLAVDYNNDRLTIAKNYGAEVCNPGIGEDPVAMGLGFSHGQGVDAVVITASTKSSDPVSQAAKMSRKRGRIVLIGVTGLDINRSDFYEKELSFQVSCSYGPGRYDKNYEELGQDYPLAFVRWTENRNFKAILDLMSQGKIDTSLLISHKFDICNAQEAYNCLTENKSALGIILQFESSKESRISKTITFGPISNSVVSSPAVSFIGAGNYASRILVPAFKKAGVYLTKIASANGLSGAVHGKKSGFLQATTDIDSVLNDKSINTIAIVTRHDSHAEYTKRALLARKNVFVEKPLALTLEELETIELAFKQSTAEGAPRLMVGFNRRFSPLTKKMKGLLDSVQQPIVFIITVNAGSISSKHWTQDPKIGGGRIIGEACHFIDLMRFLASSSIVSVQAHRMGENSYSEITSDKVVIILGFENGSFGTINYLANGAASFPKERIEAFVAGRILQLDNFRRLRGFGWPGFKSMKLWRQDKGQNACVAEFIKSIRDGSGSPIPAAELFEIARATIKADEKLRVQ